MTEADLARLGRDYCINFKEHPVPKPSIAATLVKQLEAANASLGRQLATIRREHTIEMEEAKRELDRRQYQIKLLSGERNDLYLIAKELHEQLQAAFPGRSFSTRDGKLVTDTLYLYD